MPRPPKPPKSPGTSTPPSAGIDAAAHAPTRKAPKKAAAGGRRAIRGSSSGRPIMALLDLLGRRWVLRILWELRERRLTFRGLREACDDLSPTVLNLRLRELRDAGLVELAEGEGYGLNALGLELLERFAPIVGWAERWAKATR